VKKKIVGVALALGLTIFGGSSLNTQAATWDLFGQNSQCKACGHIISKGEVTFPGIGDQAVFYGYGSTVFAGGYGLDVTAYVKVTTKVGYNYGGNSSEYNEATRTQKGTTQFLATTGYFTERFSAYFISSATASVSGYISSEDFYYALSGYGENGV
jgi:hypothetical protein